MAKKVQLAPNLEGRSFYANNIPEAQRNLEKAGLIAVPMYTLAKGFPYEEWYTPNTADFSGIDTQGRYTDKGKGVVITVHGGSDGWAFPPARIEQALKTWNASGEKSGTGVNQLYAAILNQEDIDNLLEGRMLDGNQSPVVAYEDFKGVPAVLKRYAVVRPLELARQRDSSDKNIRRLCDKNGEVTDTQLIIYAGSKEAAQKIVDKLQKEPFNWEKLGVRHPFNSEYFDAEQPQGRVPVLLSDGIGFNGYDSIHHYARCVGVAPEALKEIYGGGLALSQNSLEGMLSFTEKTPGSLSLFEKMREKITPKK